MSLFPRDSTGDHICGCYVVSNYKRRYLPQCQLKSHTTINPVCYTTKLTQVFQNSNQEELLEARYTFPLFDGIAVSGYTITYGGKCITGVVKQKDDAKKTYQAALERGDAAGLLESLPAGVFGVTLANIPARANIAVDILYCGELKHDAGIDGLRYILPTSIAPRYGSYPGELMTSNTVNNGGLRIEVDIDMGRSAVRKVQSPSHPIAVSMGGLSASDGDPQAPFQSSQASATLTQGNTELAGDFVLQLLVDDMKRPQAILETHALLVGQRAVMTTLVPNFVLETAHPELIFLADQSGSMSGSKNMSLVAALKVFIKSMPLGVRFNICAFGNSFNFLWPQSQPYSERHADEALAFVNTFSASYGGTQILEPMQEAFKRRLQDLPLEIMLLTDGEIWDESALFGFINEQIRDKAIHGRVFTLGIGHDVSHTLVEGVARAGNGFAQFVTQNEDLDQKVIRMLKGSLYAHTRDYELELHFDDTEGFEIVEKVRDCLLVTERPPEVNSTPSTPVSFFDTAVSPDSNGHKSQSDRYAHLPKLETPKILQTPSDIPPLYPWNRTTAYILLGPDSPQKDIVSLTLRATAPQGPIELNIPIQGTQSGVSIHTLAARKAIQDVEEGRGWLDKASVGGKPLKLHHQSRFDEITEREAVRLGERFQVAGKWTSFVAVQDNSNEQVSSVERPAEMPPQRNRSIVPTGAFGTQSSFAGFGAPMGGASTSRSAAPHSPAPSGGLFGMASMVPPPGGTSFGAPSQMQGALFGSASGAQNLTGGQSLQQNNSRKFMSQGSPFAAAAPVSRNRRRVAEKGEERDGDMGFGLFGGFPCPPPAPVAAAPPPPAAPPSAAAPPPTPAPPSAINPPSARSTKSPSDILHRIIDLQKFSGAWSNVHEIITLIDVGKSSVSRMQFGPDDDITATIFVVAYLENQLKSKKDVWEMVVAKARSWLRGKGVKVDELVTIAAKHIKESGTF